MYISFEYFSCNCKTISIRRFILLHHSRENVCRTKLSTKDAGCKSFRTLFQRDYVHIVGISQL